MKRFDEPGLILMGFKPLVMLKKHHYLRPSLFVYPEESLVNGEYMGFLFVDPEESLVNGRPRDNPPLALDFLSGCCLDTYKRYEWVF